MAFLETRHMFEGLANKPTTLLEMVEANRLKNQQNQQNEMTLRKQKQSVDFDEQNNPLKLAKSQFDNMSEQDKFVEQDLLQASIESTPFIDNKDSQGLVQLLQMRRNKLAQNGLRTDEIDNAIQLAQQGDFDTLKQLTGGQIQAGRMIGILQDNTDRGGGTGVIMDRLMAENPNLTQHDALLIVQGLGRQGLTPTGGGGVGQIGGYGDNRASIEGKIAGSEADATLNAEQKKQNMRVGAQNQIDSNKSLSPAVQKQIAETTTIINNTSRIVDRGIELYDKIKNGTLNLGFVTNAINNAKNGLGISTEESKALSELRTYTEELANNILSSAKGPQSDGDAVRAKNIILSGDADETIVREQLARLIKANDDIIKEQEVALDTEYKHNNKNPNDYKPQTTQQPQQSNQNDDPLGLFQ